MYQRILKIPFSKIDRLTSTWVWLGCQLQGSQQIYNWSVHLQLRNFKILIKGLVIVWSQSSILSELYVLKSYLKKVGHTLQFVYGCFIKIGHKKCPLIKNWKESISWASILSHLQNNLLCTAEFSFLKKKIHIPQEYPLLVFFIL